MYSNNAIGNKGRLTKEDMGNLDIWKDKGYVCGKKVCVQGFVLKRAIRYGEPIGSQYYNKNRTKGGRIITEDVFPLCYSVDDIVAREEFVKNRDVGGYNTLLVCMT